MHKVILWCCCSCKCFCQIVRWPIIRKTLWEKVQSTVFGICTDNWSWDIARWPHSVLTCPTLTVLYCELSFANSTLKLRTIYELQEWHIIFFLFCTYFPKQICCTIQSIIRAGLKLTVKSCTQLLIVYSYYHTFFPSLLNRFAGWIASKFCDAIPVIYFYKYNIYEMLVKVGLSAELALRQPRITRPPKSVLNSVVRQCRVTSSSFFCKHLECSKNFEVSFRFQMAI